MSEAERVKHREWIAVLRGDDPLANLSPDEVALCNIVEALLDFVDKLDEAIPLVTDGRFDLYSAVDHIDVAKARDSW